MTNKIINKSNWKLTKFGSVVTQQKESVDINRRVAGTRYIAGEHINSEDIHINKWGIVDDSYLGPAFHRTFKKGDILYGSRRTYLKKVAVSHFDGITANTTFVMQANKEVIDERLVPFLMLSDSFTKHSVKNSKGSVNPYINWKDIADYEFHLPPLDKQKELADLLWSAEQLLQTSADIKSKLNILFESKIQNFIRVNNTIVKLGDVSDITMGQSPPGESYNDEKIGIPFIQGNAEFGELNPLRHKFTNKPTKIVAMKSILMSVRAPVGDLNIANKDYCIGRGLCGINSHDSDNMYVFYLLQVLVNKLIKVASGSTFTSVDKKTIESLEIPYPEIKIRKSFSDEMQFLYQFINTFKTYEQNTKVLYKSLVNQIF